MRQLPTTFLNALNQRGYGGGVLMGTSLAAAADALIEAHKHAVALGDDKLQDLIEAALLYVGRRLAKEAQDSNEQSGGH